MNAFEVSVNSKRICTAGIGSNGVVTVMIHWVGGAPRHTVEGEVGFRVGGMDSKTEEHLEWKTPKVKVGDHVTIKIVEVDSVDPETRRYLHPVDERSRGKSKGRPRKKPKETTSKGSAR